MNDYFGGLDIGACTCKAVVIDQTGEVKVSHLIKTDPSPQKAEEIVADLEEGINYLFLDIKGLIDIGGQDSKVIWMILSLEKQLKTGHRLGYLKK